jgi:hypothetical protein
MRTGEDRSMKDDSTTIHPDTPVEPGAAVGTGDTVGYPAPATAASPDSTSAPHIEVATCDSASSGPDTKEPVVAVYQKSDWTQGNWDRNGRNGFEPPKGTGVQAYEEFRKVVVQQPAMALIVAFCIGGALAWLISRRK